eukprot:COSAG05_NODE_3745_length_1864_cov_40.348956_1_plen_24_part_10
MRAYETVEITMHDCEITDIGTRMH